MKDGQDFVCFLNNPGSESREKAKGQHAIMKSSGDRRGYKDKIAVQESLDTIFGPIWYMRRGGQNQVLGKKREAYEFTVCNRQPQNSRIQLTLNES